MKKSKMIIAAMLAAGMLLSGCGSTTDTDSGNSTVTDSSADTESTVGEGEEESTENTGNAGDEQATGDSDSEEIVAVPNDTAAFATQLKFGWNLGNTLDANGSSGLSSETSWGQPKATKELFDYLAEAGFTTVRIPVSWGNHTDSDYTIDSEWMARVNEVVDWALDAGLYVIINSHHDVDYYYPSEENMDNATNYLKTIWTQIADNFKDYDEHLIFEGMNEPRLKGTDIEWWFSSTNEDGNAAIRRISELEQVFVDTVRSSDGNNKSRYLMVSSYAASPDFTMNDNYTIPTDPYGKLLISIHAYSPYDFAMNENGYSEWDGSHSSDLSFIKKLYDTFVSKGYGVVISEFGCTNKDNIEDRVAWAKEYTQDAAGYGIPCIVWDNAGTGVGEENFGLINRRELSCYFPELLDAYLEAYR